MSNAFMYHPLTKLTVKEKLLFGLTFSQTGWVLLGIFLATKMTEFVKPLPFKLLFGYIHYFIPLLICLFLGFVTHRTGLSFTQYFISFLSYKRRKKNILNHAQPKGGRLG